MSANRPTPSPSGFIAEKVDLERTNSICKRFIFAGFIFFLITTTVGFLVLTGAIPEDSPSNHANIETHEEDEHEESHSPATFTHAHLGVYGWISFLIFGVAYKLIPTAFAGKIRVYSFRMAEAHFWIALPALSGLLLFAYLSEMSGGSFDFWVKTAFGAPLLASGFLFVINMWMTFKRQQGASPAEERPPRT